MKVYNKKDQHADDMIISGKQAISAVEVENLLRLHDAVAEAAVVAVPHDRWGEVPFAFVVAKIKGRKTAEMEAEIMAHCSRAMAVAFMVPERIVFMSELPKKATGKVKKTMLMELARRLRKSGPASPGAAPAAAAVTVGRKRMSVRQVQVGEDVLLLAADRI